METGDRRPDVPGELQHNWKYLLGAGVLVALLGVLAIFTPFVTGIALSILLGVVLVVAGLVHVGYAFSARGWTGALWQVLLAVVYVVAGLVLVANPVVGLASLTLLLVAYFAVEGVVEVVGGLAMRSEPQWGWYVLSGAVSLLLAWLLWTGFPSTALWAVGLLFGLNVLSTGLALMYAAWLGRNASKAAGTGAPGRGTAPSER